MVATAIKKSLVQARAKAAPTTTSPNAKRTPRVNENVELMSISGIVTKPHPNAVSANPPMTKLLHAISAATMDSYRIAINCGTLRGEKAKAAVDALKELKRAALDARIAMGVALLDQGRSVVNIALELHTTEAWVRKVIVPRL